MPSTAPLLIDLAGVARLAGVQRPVASMWRARFASSADPFPSAADEHDGRTLFDAMAVARWLARTDHGNNPDAVADAAASSYPHGFDVTSTSHVAGVDALLTLHAVTGEPVGGVDIHTLGRMAAAADPDDCCLSTEMASIHAAWPAWADLLADAAYSPLEASRILERRHAATRSWEGSVGPLSMDAEALIADLATALAAGRAMDLSINGGVSPSLATELASRHSDADLAVPASPEGRAIRRRLLLDGMPLPSGFSSAATPRLVVQRLPGARVRHIAEMLRAVDDTVLDMRDDDRAIVVAPAAVLTERLSPADGLARTDVLRSGRVRAIVKLPAGLVSSAVREPLAVWVLGREAGEVPVADRFTAMADLSGTTLTVAARTDLTSDVLASMGSAGEVRAHAFRFARLVRTTALLASRGALVASRSSTAAGVAARDLPALLDQARDALGDSVPTAAPTAAGVAALPAATVENLVADRHLRVLSGTRVGADEFAVSGLMTVGAAALDAPETIGARRVDPLEFAVRHPSARLTEPGDIIFRTSPTARAWVDPNGSKVVAHPARVLRIDRADPGGLVPELVAADINRSDGGPAAWRRWRLRRVAPAAAESLRAALSDLAAQRRSLAERIQALDAYAELLTAGVVSGAVTLIPSTAPAASDPK